MTDQARRDFVYAHLRGLRVVVDETVPLFGGNLCEPVLCWVVGAEIRVHPDRWADFRLWMPAKELN